MKKIFFLTLLVFLLSKSMNAQVMGLVGEVRLFAGNFAPQGWLKCEGQTLPLNVSDYQALFSIIGTTYGGNPPANFKLPDYRGRTAAGPSASLAYGTQRGTETVALTTANLPDHNHSAALKVSQNAATLQIPTVNSVMAAPSISVNNTLYPIAGFNNDNASTSLKPFQTSLTGSNTPINVSQPSLVLTYIICYQGLYPSRP